MMKVAHDTMVTRYMGVTKTEDSLLTNNFCQGIYQDILSFWWWCDVCQMTVSKGSVAKVPFGKLPLMDLPFKRMVVNLIFPITSPSDKRNRYVLFLVN